MKNLKFKIMANLVDGTPVIFDGEFVKDTPVYVIDEQGKEVPALDGEHQLEDGTKFVTVAGKISEIFPAEYKPEESDVEEEMMKKDKEKEMKMLTQEEYDGFMSLVEQMKAMLEELKAAKEEVSMRAEQKLSEIVTSSSKNEIVVDKQEMITRNLSNFFKRK